MRVVWCLMIGLALATPALAAKPLEMNAFSFELPVMLPGTPEQIFDAATGDISGWWDHSFRQPPRLILEPKVGGSFIELFDDKGNGARHAVVITCDRPKLIRFEGPLGLAGHAVQMVHTYTFEAVGNDSTKLTLSVQGAGAVSDKLGGVVEGVWKHFLIERFKPYVESGKHKGKKHEGKK